MKIKSDPQATQGIQVIYAEASRLVLTFAPAQKRMRDQTAGYPSQVHGAGPASTSSTSPDEDPVTLTSVEAAAINGTADVAQRDLDAVHQAIGQIIPLMVLIGRIADRYHGGVVSARDRIKDVDALWCSNGHMAPRHGKHTLCRWCESFRAAEGVVPPRNLVELHDAGRKITEADVARSLGRTRVKKRSKAVA